MKKQLSGILAMLMCLTCFSACDVVNNAKDFVVGGYNKVEGWVGGLFGKEEKVNEKLKSAAEFLKQSLLEDKNNVEARADYELERKSIGFNVTWTVNVTEGDPNGVVVLDYEDEPKVIIDVDEAAKEDILYTLTGTLKDAEGLTETVSVNRKVLKSGGVPKELTTAPEVGVAYKFFVYHEEFKQDYYFTGAMDGYYYGVTQASAEAADVYAEYVAGSTTEYYLYTKKDETSAKKYLTLKREPGNDGKDHNNLGLSEEEGSKFRFDDKLKTMVCDVTSSMTCYIGTFDKNDDIRASDTKYATNATSYVGGLVTLIERETVSDADKAKFEAEALKIKTKFNGSADSFRLPVKGRRFPDVKISWEVEDNELVTLNARKDRLSVAAYTEKSSVKLTATLTIGDETKTVEINLNLALLYTTPEEIVNAAYALAENESLDDPYTLTGVITKVTEPYSSYENISVEIQVGDMTDKPILCYRIKGDGADVIKVGDTITVTGIITNYKGTIEFTTGSSLDSYVEGEGGNQGGEDEVVDSTLPAANAEISIAKALAVGNELTSDTADKYYVTGKITEIANTTYGNMYIEDASGNSIYVYGTYDASGAKKYGDMTTTKPVVGDTVKLYSKISNYNNAAQLKNAWIMEINGVSQGTVTPPAGDDTPSTTVPTAVTSLEAGKAYNMFMNQETAGKIVYLSGGMAATYYLATSESASAAIAVYVEETTGGYYLYTYDNNVKTYINLVVNDAGTHINGKYQTTASTVYTFNTEYNTLVDAEGNFLGTRGSETHTTIGGCFAQYIAENFVAQFIVDADAPNDDNQGGGTVTPPAGDDDTTTLTTPEEIVNAAYALGDNEDLAGTYTLTGVVIEISSAYNSEYSNVSVVIQVGNMADKPITCYRMKGTGADVIKVGDTITCTGTLTNYVGDYGSTIEFKAGCTLDSYVVGEAPVLGEATLSFADTTNRTEFTTEVQVWEANGITLTNTKGSSNIADYSNPARFYKGSKVVIEFDSAITKIVFTAGGYAEHKAAINDTLTAAGYTVTVEGNNYIVEFSQAVTSMEFTMAAQGRVAEIAVTFAN